MAETRSRSRVTWVSRAAALMLFMLIPGTLDAAPSLVHRRFAEVNPAYLAPSIPDDPGQLRLVLPSGDQHITRFFGSSNFVLRHNPRTPIELEARSDPGQRVFFGFQFFQGAGFTWGLPRSYRIDAGNRWSNRGDGYGMIRVAAGTDQVRYELAEGVLRFEKFTQMPRVREQFRSWRVQGSFSGTLARVTARSPQAEALPKTLELKTVTFDCVLVEDRNPIPNSTGQVVLKMEDFGTPEVTVAARASFRPELPDKAFDLVAPRSPGAFQVLFQVRQASNISWPPAGRYILNRATVDPPEIFTSGTGSLPLVLSVVQRPQPDVQLHYLPVSGELRFTEATFLAADEGREYWRVKGTFNGHFELYAKIGIGISITRLDIDRQTEFEAFKLTEGTFDVLVPRQGPPTAGWRLRFPEIDPNLSTGPVIAY